MMHPEPLPWINPLNAAASFAAAGAPMVLLHSSLPHPQHGQRSILAVGLAEETSPQDGWAELAHKLAETKDSQWHQRWFGFLGYEMGTDFLPAAAAPATIALPRLWFAKFRSVLVFDHTTHSLTRWGESCGIADTSLAAPQLPPEIAALSSNMTKAGYLNAVEKTLEQIAAGEFYQANITRKFFGNFAAKPDGFALFRQLCDASPGSYSAYLRIGEVEILSSSPECFLSMDAAGRVESRPIKGTAPAESDPALLAASEKDRAENLMIVDLMRNDLSQHCLPGSVQTQKLFEVTRYATLHHMDSTITGQRRTESSGLQLIKGCFPPGSMTGAPKRAVIQWCQQQEAMQRGIYSGALGWLAADGSADLSVVIRTLLLQGDRFEFQVGGGIVADSLPEKEWQETLVKARGIASCLGLSAEALTAP